MSSTQEVGDIFGHGKGSAQAMLRSPTVLILCVGLWGMNIFFYRLFGLDYKYILNLDLIEIEKEEAEKAQLHSKGSGSPSTFSREVTSSSGGGGGSGDANNTATSSKLRRRTTNDEKGHYVEASSNDFDDNVNGGGGGNELEMVDISINADSAGSGNGSPRQKNSLTQVIMLSPESGNDLPSPPPSLPPTLPQQGDSGSPILWYKLVLFSVSLLFLLHFSTHYWIDHLHRSSIGAVFFFYFSVLVYISVPFRQNGWLRRSFGIVVMRAWALIRPRCSCITLAGTTIPPRRVPFVDVFFADAMCSLSKVFFDWGMLAHQAIHYPNPVPPATHNIVIPSLCAALPYVIRARQCLIMHTVGLLKRDPKKHHHLMNAFKYSTSMYPLLLSAYLKTLAPGSGNIASLEMVLTFLLIVNASYSLYWDIVMDWGMMQDPYRVAQSACGTEPVKSGNGGGRSAIDACLRPSLRFGLLMTVLIVVGDSFLRFSWVLKFVPRLFPSDDAFVLCTQFLEVFRRAIWNLLRVEWEHIKQQRHAASLSNKTSSERDLLASMESQQEPAASKDGTDRDDAKELEMKAF
mmetsp:Transcript_18328/g.42227  ORF Transcript_18328/g.42227 Transcript_18328/m.42227 type:complete len:574 (+) Transcript_18328:198-1919(+)